MPECWITTSSPGAGSSRVPCRDAPESLPPRRASARGHRLALAMALTFTLAGCIHYSPRPLPPERVAGDFAHRRLEDSQLQAALNAKLPARAGNWPRARWDRADLVAVMLYFNDAVAE